MIMKTISNILAVPGAEISHLSTNYGCIITLYIYKMHFRRVEAYPGHLAGCGRSRYTPAFPRGTPDYSGANPPAYL